MKGLHYLLIITCISLLTLNCQKENSFDLGGPDVTGSKPAPVTAAIQGNILDENGQPAAGVLVKVGSRNATTDSKGFFRINGAALDKNASVVTAEKPGYFKSYRNFSATKGVNYIKIKLIPKVSAGTVDAASGGAVTLPNGAKISLPENGVVKANGSTAYSGEVRVYASYIDPTASDITERVPGSFVADDKNNNRVILTSYGMMAVELESATGEKLQVAPGSKATLTSPIPASIQGSAPASIPLWYVDEVTGVWKEEGSAGRSGNNYVGEVSHFSFWNCDIAANAVVLSLTLKDNEGAVLANTLVTLTPQNQWSSSAGGYTDSAGQVSGWVPANLTLLLEVKDPCNNVVHSQMVGPFSQNTNLGVITLNNLVSPSLLTIKGKVKNCSGGLVTDGYVLVNFENIPRFASINSSGEFSLSTLRCPGGATTVDILAVDKTTQQQGTVVTLNVSSAQLVDAGDIIACGVSSNEFLDYTIDGTSYSLNSNFGTDSLTAFTFPTQSSPALRTWVSGFNSNNNTGLAFTFNHNASTGTYAVEQISVQGLDSLEVVAPFNVVLTKYPATVGEFFEGTFSGKFRRITAPLPTRNINGSFRLRRLN